VKMISDLSELQFWIGVSAHDPALPFEIIAHRKFSVLVAASYSVLFDEGIVRACCNWSRSHLDEQVAAFFVEQDTRRFFEDAGYYGGVVFNGEDNHSDVHQVLFKDQNGSPLLSIYEASQRMFLLPEDASWMLIGDRGADVALLCFSSEDERSDFLGEDHTIRTFGSLAEGARHSRSFMQYPWSPEVTGSEA